MTVPKVVQTRLAAALVALAAVSFVPAAGASPFPADFFVATNGNDSWSGKLAAPNAAGNDGPFATLAHARDTVRALKSKGLKAPVTVMIHGGKYFLEDTVVFSADDSGTREALITYQAYPGERPVLSGGRRVTGW